MFKGVGLFLIALFSVQISWAQTSTDDVITVDGDNSAEEISVKIDQPKEAATETPSNKNIEKINVTGSHIKRIDVEGPSPVVTMDSELFEVTGVNTVTDLVKESPLFERAGEGGYFRFHGQHAGNTLILLNGMRIPKLGAPGSDFYNGINGIPTNALDRVEILKDGSSATYGSDAIAGVVNFITKKDYDGAEFSSRVTAPETGAGIEQNYTMSFGKNYSKGNWLTTVQYVNKAGVTEADIGSSFRGAVYNGIASQATFRPKGGEKLDTRQTCGTDDNGKPIRCDQAGDLAKDQFRSPKENIAALMTGRYDISSDLSVSLLGMYNHQQTSSYGNPNVISMNAREGGGPLDLSKLNGNSLSQKLNGNTGLSDVSITPREEIGFSESNTVEDSFNVQARAEGFFSSTDTWGWQADAAYANMVQTTNHTNGITDLNIVRGMLESGAYDPTLPVGQKNNALAQARVTPREQYVSDMMMARLVSSGELFDFKDLWGAGAGFSIALGGEAQWETVGVQNDDVFSTGNLSRTMSPNQDGERQIQSGFLEMTAYPLESLEFQMAARYDNYSDVGSITNPKLALGFRPSNKALFRASWGTNFHAPSIHNMIFQENQGFERFQDATCDASVKKCSSQYYPVTRYRDPEIGPEKGQHYNIGTVIQPNRNWTFTVDQWNFEGTDTIAKIYGDRYTQYDKLQPGVLNDLGVTVIRDNEGEITSVRAPEIVNLGERTIRGLDFKIDFVSKMNLFGVPVNGGASFDHSHFLLYKTKRFDAIPWETREDLDWKNTTSLFVSTTAHYYRLAVRTVAGGNGDYRSGAQIPTHTEYDFTYALTAGWGGKFSFGIKNLLNSSIPNDQLAGTTFLRGSGSRDFDAFSALGRRYFAGYSQSF